MHVQNVSNKPFSGPPSRLFCQALISISREKTNATREKFNVQDKRGENKENVKDTGEINEFVQNVSNKQIKNNIYVLP